MQRLNGAKDQTNEFQGNGNAGNAKVGLFSGKNWEFPFLYPTGERFARGIQKFLCFVKANKLYWAAAVEGVHCTRNVGRMIQTKPSLI
jgi:hypothetical protein